MTSFAVRSFGCRVNQAEAFGWVEELRRGGFRLEEDSGRGDYLLVNSCTLTGRADRDVRRFIRRAARENPKARIVITGCTAGRASEEFRRMPGVWMVVPNAGKDGLAASVLEAAGARGEEA
ncbi:MAG TPA: tRNA (N(6)-L-threonylcarbamoyladenosine(37)-C(2))-methylthiotransferase MtaB, partial [Acidobacteriota bacterium]|nr:tRNA (N(6)-L-threonylcarbamoyladenosine(37)-C(2))-methylthiotransferase MtaB [Acidobacteriota bacterium]